MKFGHAREARRGRIEIILMIDVMFFLLVTFMLASLSMQSLHSVPVDLPSGEAVSLDARQPVTLAITGDWPALPRQHRGLPRHARRDAEVDARGT